MARRLYRMVFRVVPVVCLVAAVAAASAGPTETGALDVHEVVDRARTKVVVLKLAGTRSQTSATGFVAGPGLVVTVAHAVESTSRLTAWMNGASYPARVVRTRRDDDLALLRIEAKEVLVKPLPLSPDSRRLEREEALVILAGPSQAPGADSDPRNRLPIPARFRDRVRLKAVTTGPVLALRAHVEKGDSGSPVLRVRDGAVVGMLSSREVPGADGLSSTAYAVPVEAFRPWVEDREPVGGERFYLLPRP